MTKRHSVSKLAVWAFLVAGILLRLWYYLDGRSLFIDEANLALNISELGYGGFFRPLYYDQYAPPLFMVFSKGAVQLLGNHEWALRLWPLAGSLLMLLLFRVVIQKLGLSSAVQWFPIAMLALSPFLLRYGTEVKQYSTDAAVALGLALLALNLPPEGLRRRHFLLWALVGGISLWLSMPAAFVLCGVAARYSYGMAQQRQWKALWLFSLAGAFWLASFLALYFTVLRASLATPELLSYHAPYFLPVRLWEAKTWQQMGHIGYGLLSPVLGFTVAGLAVGIAALLFGSFRLARRQPGTFLLLAVPILACLAASALRHFSLISRVSLFLMPLFLLLAAYGASEAWRIGGRFARPALLALLLLEAAPFFNSIQHMGKATAVENLKDVLRKAKAANKGGIACIDHDAAPAYRYYSQWHAQREAFILPDAVLLNWDTSLGPLLEQQARGPGFWLVFSHLLSREPREKMARMRGVAQEVAEETLSIEEKGAAGYWYEY